MIRELRTEIKDAANKYTDEKSKATLNWTLGTVIDRLEMMKKGMMKAKEVEKQNGDIHHRNCPDHSERLLEELQSIDIKTLTAEPYWAIHDDIDRKSVV